MGLFSLLLLLSWKKQGGEKLSLWTTPKNCHNGPLGAWSKGNRLISGDGRANIEARVQLPCRSTTLRAGLSTPKGFEPPHLLLLSPSALPLSHLGSDRDGVINISFSRPEFFYRPKAFCFQGQSVIIASDFGPMKYPDTLYCCTAGSSCARKISWQESVTCRT